METDGMIQESAHEAVNQLVPGDDEATLFQFMGRIAIGAVAVIAGYYIYATFLSRSYGDHTDALVKKILDDPIGNLFKDAKQSMDKKTSEWWQSVRETFMTEELRNALDSIGDVLQQLNKFDSELEIKPTRLPLFVLLGIIRRAQEEQAASGHVKLPPNIEDDLKEDDEVDSVTDAKGNLILI